MSSKQSPLFSEDVHHTKVYGDVQDIAHQMAQEVLLALAEVVEDINTSHHEFRSALESTAARVMKHIDKSSERIGIYEETLPGFTLMVIKKDDGNIQKTDRKTVEDPEVDEGAFEAAAMLIEQFMKRTQHTIISIEHASVLLVLFPVNDTRKHLKALGFLT
jgi:hypothetical protein